MPKKWVNFAALADVQSDILESIAGMPAENIEALINVSENDA